MANMKTILLLGTGGTIAGWIPPGGTPHSYQPGALPVTALLSQDRRNALAEPGITVRAEQLFNLGSEDLTPAHWLQLAQRIDSLVHDAELQGIVITHGTDTLEETAWFLQCTLHTHIPVVMTAAMRAANAPDADGPDNLWQALRVAAHADAVGRGVLVCMQGQVRSARYVRKMHTQRITAFNAPESAGKDDLVAIVQSQQIIWNGMAPTAQASGTYRLFDVSHLKQLPDVAIVYGYAGVQAQFVQALWAQQVQGIVYAAVGNGTLSTPMRAALHAIARQGCTVVRASRVPYGAVSRDTAVPEDAQWLLSAGDYTPQQARVLLMLLLACLPPDARTVMAMQKYFES